MRLLDALPCVVHCDSAHRAPGEVLDPCPADLSKEWADGRRQLLGVLVVGVVAARRGGDLYAQALAKPASDLGQEWKRSSLSSLTSRRTGAASEVNA